MVIGFFVSQLLINMVLFYSSLVADANRNISTFITIFITLLMYTLGLFVAVILSVGSLMELMCHVGLPLYIFLTITLFCSIGQHLKNSVRKYR